MAKETMQAINEAEKNARLTLQKAREECDRLIDEAQLQSQQLEADAVKDARKKVEVLCGVARADAEKTRARALAEIEEEQKRLRQNAESCKTQVLETIQHIVLGGA